MTGTVEVTYSGVTKDDGGPVSSTENMTIIN